MRIHLIFDLPTDTPSTFDASPKVYSPHPLMSADDIRRRTQEVWDRFSSLAAIWQRSDGVRTIRSRMPGSWEPSGLGENVESNRLTIGVVT